MAKRRCVACLAESVVAHDRCGACAMYWTRHGVDPPPEVLARRREPLVDRRKRRCVVCGRPGTHTRDRCTTCARYLVRTGQDRPASLLARATGSSVEPVPKPRRRPAPRWPLPSVELPPTPRLPTGTELVAALALMGPPPDPADPPPPWMANAACAAVPTFVFFPDDDKPTAETAAVCDGCETRLECLHAGLCERHGVWGGMSARSRARLRHVLRRLQRTA